MGITQHEHGTQNVQQLVNLLLMKGNIGKLVRVSAHYVDTLMYRATEPSVSPRNRLQSFWLVWVSAMASPHLMHWTCCNCQHASNMYGAGSSIDLHGGNFALAMPDREASAVPLTQLDLAVHVATKLNRSHLLTARHSYILPVLGRSEIDMQKRCAGGNR